MIMFVVYTIMLLRYQEDMWIVYDEYPEAVVYLISATALYGIEYILQVITGTIYNLDCGLKVCKPTWFYIISSMAHTYWGISHIFSSRFDKMAKSV